MRWPGVVLVICAGCGPKGPGRTSEPAHTVGVEATPAPEPTETIECPERVKIMRKRLELAGERPAELGVEEGITVPRFEKAVGEPVKDAPMVSIGPDGVIVDGQKADDIVELLERKRELWKTFNPGKTMPEWRLLFTVDATLPAKQLRDVVEPVRKAGWAPWLMVRIPDYPHIERDPPAWVRSLLKSIRAGDMPPTELVGKLSDAVARAARPCAALKPAFGAISDRSVAPEEKGTILAGTVPKAVLACDCKLDVDALEALLVEILAGSDVRHRMVRVPAQITDAGTVDDLLRR